MSGRSSRVSTEFAIVLLVLSSIIWGGSFVSVKIGLGFLNVYDFVFLRLGLASVILMAALTFRGGLKANALKEGSVWLLGLLNGVAFSLQYVGLIFTTAGKTALLVNLNIIMVALLSRRMFAESFGYRKILGVALGVTGAALITINGDFATLGRGELVGDALVFSAGLVWAFFIVLHKRLLSRNERNVIELSAVVMFATAVVLLPVAVVLGGLNLGMISFEGWGWVALTAVAFTILPYGLWLLALKAVTATTTSVVAMLEIVAAMVLSGFFLGEAYNTFTVLGAVMILFSILAVAES